MFDLISTILLLLIFCLPIGFVTLLTVTNLIDYWKFKRKDRNANLHR